jgi:hypothetical protein
LEISLIDDFIDPITAAEEEVIEQIMEGQNQAVEHVFRMEQRLSALALTLQNKQQPRYREVRLPDNDTDPILFIYEQSYGVGMVPFLTLEVVDTVTREKSNARITLVPEPSTLGLFGAGLVFMGIIRRRSYLSANGIQL